MGADLWTHASAAGQPKTLQVARWSPDPDGGFGAAKERRLGSWHGAVPRKAARGAPREERPTTATPRSGEEARSRRRSADEPDGKRAKRSAPAGGLNASCNRARGSVRKSCLSIRKDFAAE